MTAVRTVVVVAAARLRRVRGETQRAVEPGDSCGRSSANALPGKLAFTVSSG
jgi:hypothetical protein